MTQHLHHPSRGVVMSFDKCRVPILSNGGLTHGAEGVIFFKFLPDLTMVYFPQAFLGTYLSPDPNRKEE